MRRAIAWSRWYAIASYAKSSLWIVPFVAIVLELLVSRFVQGLGERLGWTLLGLHQAGARSLYETIITMTLSFTVFTFGSLLVAIQVAGGQLTPRVIATTLLRDNTVRYTVGVFVFTLLYSLRELDRLDETVGQLNIFIAGALGLLCLGMFLFLIDYAARLLRPVSIIWRIGQAAIGVVDAVHPRALREVHGPMPPRLELGKPAAVILHAGTSGTVLAINQQALVAEAQAGGTAIEVVPHVGDFIAVDEPLFRVYGGALTVPDDELRATIAVGPERTMEQDATFGFRILVDIALKALSKAINDPTTAVLAIDQIHRLLRVLGNRYLQHEQIMDSSGRMVVIIHTPNWEDYVHLACREIRLHGGDHIQVARRLRAMIENLIGTLPAVRHPALLEELDLLDRMAQIAYSFPEDLALARVADPQGLGGVTTYARNERAGAGPKAVDAA